MLSDKTSLETFMPRKVVHFHFVYCVADNVQYELNFTIGYNVDNPAATVAYCEINYRNCSQEVEEQVKKYNLFCKHVFLICLYRSMLEHVFKCRYLARR